MEFYPRREYLQRCSKKSEIKERSVHFMSWSSQINNSIFLRSIKYSFSRQQSQVIRRWITRKFRCPQIHSLQIKFHVVSFFLERDSSSISMAWRQSPLVNCSKCWNPFRIFGSIAFARSFSRCRDLKPAFSELCFSLDGDRDSSFWAGTLVSNIWTKSLPTWADHDHRNVRRVRSIDSFIMQLATETNDDDVFPFAFVWVCRRCRPVGIQICKLSAWIADDAVLLSVPNKIGYFRCHKWIQWARSWANSTNVWALLNHRGKLLVNAIHSAWGRLLPSLSSHDVEVIWSISSFVHKIQPSGWLAPFRFPMEQSRSFTMLQFLLNRNAEAVALAAKCASWCSTSKQTKNGSFLLIGFFLFPGKRKEPSNRKDSLRTEWSSFQEECIDVTFENWTPLTSVKSRNTGFGMPGDHSLFVEVVRSKSSSETCVTPEVERKGDKLSLKIWVADSILLDDACKADSLSKVARRVDRTAVLRLCRRSANSAEYSWIMPLLSSLLSSLWRSEASTCVVFDKGIVEQDEWRRRFMVVDDLWDTPSAHPFEEVDVLAAVGTGKRYR